MTMWCENCNRRLKLARVATEPEIVNAICPGCETPVQLLLRPESDLDALLSAIRRAF